MIRPEITIHWLEHNNEFLPGEQLAAEVRVAQSESAKIAALECSVLWYTVGKGEEDLAVHLFERTEADSATKEFSLEPKVLECTLPASPLSYDGIIVKVCWCVRVRLFLQDGTELVEELPFRLGAVPAAAILEEET